MTCRATVESVTDLTPNVKRFRLRVEGHEFSYDPGQHTHADADAADADDVDDESGDDEQSTLTCRHGWRTGEVCEYERP